MEIAFDVTRQVAQSKQLRHALDAEQMVHNCVRCLMQEEQDEGMLLDSMLRQLGQDLSADRAYLFAVHGDRMDNTNEWCADQVAPEIENLQGLDAALMGRWIQYFARNECVIIEDMESIREISPEEYAVLSAQNIHSLVAAPLTENGVIKGYLGVDNPAVDRIQNISPLLLTLQYFLMATLRRLNDRKRMIELSYRDMLTGLNNRNRYIEDLEMLEGSSCCIGAVFMDLNGLKEINDSSGHSAGDDALIDCAKVLTQAFPAAQCYRIGGDEFVAIEQNTTEETFEGRVQALRRACAAQSRFTTAIGACWARQAENLQKMMQLADSRMYEEKRRYYRSQADNEQARETAIELLAESPAHKEYTMLMRAAHASVSKHLLRADYPVLWANDYFYEMSGYSRAEFDLRFAHDCRNYFAGDSVEEGERLARLVREAFDQGKTGYEALLRLPRKNAEPIWVNLVGTFTEERVDGLPVIYVVMTDANDIVQMRKEQGVAYESLPGFVLRIRFTKSGPIVLGGNRRFNELYGDLAEGKSKELMQQNLEENREVWELCAPQYFAGMPISAEIQVNSLYGQQTHFQACGGCVDWLEGDPIYLFICIDISEIVSQRGQLQKLAFVDPVTHGRNRASFELDAGGAVASAPANSYVLVSMDVQKFKVINDLFGIEAGDQVLRHIYDCIQKKLRTGEFVTRISADMFSMLLRMDEPKQIERRLQAITADINSFNLKLEHKYLLAMTMGIYPIDDPQLPMTQMQDRANVARKQIQRVVGSQLCVCQYYSNLDRIRMAQEKDIENRMEDALKNGEFLVYYQPKLDLQTGKVAGAEALVRWQDPARGLVFPGDFIPLFEANGFVVQLDLYVFEQACAMLRRWIDTDMRPIPVSVNMSRAHLNDRGFLRRYERIRQKYGVSASLLEIEVTETLFFENPQLLIEIIDEIHACGYRCSMDDFGSGYSSLNMLRNIRVDTIKLDRAFFSSAQMDDPREAVVVAGVVELAKKLKMTTVAEGVETQGQADFLRTAGCDLFQGYLFSRPVSGLEFEKMAFGRG